MKVATRVLRSSRGPRPALGGRAETRWIVVALAIAFPSWAASEETDQLSEIDVGEWVEAEIIQDKLGHWATRELDVKGSPKEVSGSITGPLSRNPDGELSVLGIAVAVTSRTAIKDMVGENVPVETLADGTVVEAHGARQEGRFVATKLRARPPGTDLEIEGPVEAISLEPDRRIRILDFEVDVLDDVRVRSLDKRPRFIRLADDDDLLPASFVSIGPLRVGGTATAEGRREDNLDLNRDREENLTQSDVTGRLEALGQVTERIHLYAKGGYRHRFILQDQGGDEVGAGRWEFEQGYLLLLGLGLPELALQIGRQQFDETREWVYRKNLDAVRLHFLGERLWGEISASTRLDETDPALSAAWNAMATLGFAARPHLKLGAYVLRRTFREGRGEGALTWYGARVLSARLGRLRGWAEGALLSGDEFGDKVHGNGVHISSSFLIRSRGRVMVNAAWARGSGDSDGNPRENGTFRQTGLQRNNDRWGGVTSFRYYGELFRPELSNLMVFSLGIGARPLSSASIDIVWHRYEQVEPAPSLAGSDLEAGSPTGLDADIGQEFDFIVGIRPLQAIRIEYVLAAFLAGRAFPSDTERAVSSRLQIDVGI